MAANSTAPRFEMLLLTASLLLVGIGSPAAQLRPFSPDEQRALAAKVLATARVSELAKGQRMRVLSVVPAQDKEREDVIAARLTVLNYATGQAIAVLADPASGTILDVEHLKGRPQASAEEREEARSILRAAPLTAALVKQDRRIEGGFVVDPPAGRPTTGRYLEFHILSLDGTRIEAEAVVDLAGRTVASLQREGEKGGGS